MLLKELRSSSRSFAIALSEASAAGPSGIVKSPPKVNTPDGSSDAYEAPEVLVAKQSLPASV